MAKVLVNYVYNKLKDKYYIINSEYVFADQPVAIMDLEMEIREPLVVPIDNSMTVVDRGTYELTNKLFKLLVVEDGKIIESENGTPVWLPRKTDISRLRYINNALVLEDIEEITETVEEPKKEVIDLSKNKGE